MVLDLPLSCMLQFEKFHADALTLPVRRYLAPTPSTKVAPGGGGVEPTPHDFGNDRLYNLQLWQAIRTIYER